MCRREPIRKPRRPMAEERENRRSYPYMSTTSWWALRKRFKGTIPGRVTGTYLASALEMSETSAVANVLPSLRSTGIIDDDGKPTERAVKWRDDDQYPKVCEEIRKAVYPQELRDLANDASADREVVEKWFANHTGTGTSMVGKMASFYLMLCRADPAKQAEPPAAGAGARPAVTRRERASPAARPPRPAAPVVARAAAAGTGNGNGGMPSLNINVQIHISADASADQIDQIFASMAKHLRQQQT
jgi:Family of unknown function (DUF5343)